MSMVRGKAWQEQLGALAPLESLYLALAFLPGEDDEPPERFVKRLLEQVPVDADVRTHLEHHHPGRLVVYRRLMRNNLRGVLEMHIPRARARLGEEFDVIFSDFLNDRAPTSHFLRDVTADFIDFWGQGPPRAPAYVLELAHLEAVRIEVASAVAAAHNVSVELSLDVRLVFAESVRLLEFHHAVHLLPDDEEDRTIPERAATYILVYRDKDTQVRYLSLQPISFHTLAALHRGESLGDSVTQGTSGAGVPLDSASLAMISELLGSLSERGVICGTLSPKSSC